MGALRTGALGALLATGLACGGGLENVPLTLGSVRGTLVGGSTSSTVSVFGQPDLLAHAASDGTFEIQGVPQGEVELLVLISSSRNELVLAQVEGGGVTDIGRRSGRPTATLEVELLAPSSQRVVRGTVSIPGTPLQSHLEDSGWNLRVPGGCYSIVATVQGLGTQTVQTCVSEGQQQAVEIHFASPDGSPGHEGCSVTGCDSDYQCRSDGSCDP
jgi:hypothetical protein